MSGRPVAQLDSGNWVEFSAGAGFQAARSYREYKQGKTTDCYGQP